MPLPIAAYSLFASLVSGIAAAYLAKKRGKNPYLWFAIGSVLGSLGLFFLFFQQGPKTKRKPLEKRAKAPPPSIGEPKGKLWYYLDPTHTQMGPMSHHALSRAWQEGKISKKTLVWNEEMTEWASLDTRLEKPAKFPLRPSG